MSNEERMTRNEQREAARAKAREIRESQKRSAKRNRIVILTSIITGVALVLGGIIAAIAIKANEPVNNSYKVTNMDFDGGIRLGKNMEVVKTADETVPNIIVFQDLQCPNCRDFEVPNNAQLRDLVNKGEFTLQIHPVSFLDGSSANQYSSRAGGATMCVAKYEPNRFFDYSAALFEHQPDEGTVGPGNDELSARAKSIGITNTKVLDCISNGELTDEILNYTRALFNGAFTIPGVDFENFGTPYIVLNGQHFQGDWTNPAAFSQWLTTTAANK